MLKCTKHGAGEMGSAVKSTGSQGPGFSFQDPHCGLLPRLVPVPKDMLPLLTSAGTMYACGACIYL